MIPTIVILAHILGAFSSFHAVMSTRTAQGAIAWAVSLKTYLAVPAYWVFGRSRFQGYVTARQAADRSSRGIPEDLAKELETYLRPRSDRSGSREVGEGEYRDRSFWFRLGVRLARLTAPIQ